MGRATFNADTFSPSPGHQIVVMTSHPEKYKSFEIPGQMEFTSESPVELSSRFASKGQQQMMVVGGPHVATSFLQEQLIDELWLTIEPRIFAMGENFATDAKLDIYLRLIQSDKVNDQGTLITKYAVLKK
jgi:dihydrofolate reductase